MHTTSKNKNHTCASRGGGAKAARRRRNWPWDWVTLAPQNLHSKGRGQREACQGVQREGGCSPAPGRCRRWSTRHAHTGGLMPPCSRSDRLKGTPDRGGRSQAGPGDRLGGRVWEQVGARGFWASGDTRAPGPPQPPVRMVSTRQSSGCPAMYEMSRDQYPLIGGPHAGF